MVFWLSMLSQFSIPIPPTPQYAMLSVSLGAWYPRPSTWRGTIMGGPANAPSAREALPATKSRRVTVFESM